MKIIVVCQNKNLLATIYVSLGDVEASPVVLHATGCAGAVDTLNTRDDIGMVLVDSDLVRGTDAENFGRLRVLEPALPFLMVSDSTKRKHIRAAVEEIRARSILESSTGQAFLSTLVAKVSGGFPLPDEEGPTRSQRRRGPADRRRPAVIDVETGPAPGVSNVRQETPESLTERQREVLNLMCDGKSNKEIGRQLDISEGTVKAHCRAIFRELGVRSRMAAAARFVQRPA